MATKTKTTSKNTPWAPAQPFVTDSLSQAQNANTAGQATIGMATPALNGAISRLSQNLETPPQYMRDAETQFGRTVNGDFVGSNPQSDHLADLIAQKTGAQYNSTFGASGRAHGGMAALLSGQGIGDALSSFYGSQYDRERQLQQQAIMGAGQFRQGQNVDLNQLMATTQGAALLPGQVAGNYANTITAATSPYVQNTTTQKTGGLGQVLSTGLGLAAQIGGAAMTGGASLGMGAMGGGLGGLLAGSAPMALSSAGPMATNFGLSRFLG